MSQLDITYRGTVHQWHCDHMGHMNVMWYVGKFDEATWNLAAMMGLNSQYLKSANRGMAALDQRISYKREAVAGDVVTVRSAVLMMVVAVHLDTVARKSIAFEPGIAAKTSAIIAPDPTLWDKWPPEQGYLT
jgi:acyl-CoA thioester hydrolase